MANPALERAARGGYADFSAPPSNVSSVPWRGGTTQPPGRVTVQGVLSKVILQFGLLLPAAVIAWFFTPPALAQTVLLGSLVAGAVLSLIISFSKRPSPALIFTYAVMEGVFVGGLSRSYEYLFEGVVVAALAATTITVAVITLGVRAGWLRTSSRMRKVLLYGFIGYGVFSLVALVAALLGHGFLTFGSPLLTVVTVVGVVLAAWLYLRDVELVQEMERSGAPVEMEWKLSFGLVASLVWLYLEILRMIANFMALARD